jgi:outer membrane protein assembly factor BamB
MFRGNHQLTGVSATTLPDQPDVLWRYDAGEAIESSAAIVGGLVFFGAFDGKFHCVDLESGEPRWVRTFRKDEFADPEDRPTTAPARVEFVPAIYSSPAVAEGRVFFGDEMGNFYALDAWTGRTLWKFEAQGDIRSSPNVIGETVMIGSGDGHVYNLDVATGELVWKFATDDQIRCVPGTADGLTYIAGCDGFIRGIDIATGEQMMSLPIGSQMGASPAMHRGKLFAGIYGNAVIGVDLRDPKVIWAYDPPRKDFPFEASAAIARDRIVIGGKDKAVHCIDLETGAPIWQFETGAAVISSPIVVGDRAFIGSGDGKLYALDLQSGELKWSFETGAAVTASPAAALGRLIVGDVNGILYCFGERGAR